MKTMLALAMLLTLTACGSIQTVSDLMNAVENQRNECYGAIDRLAAKGVTLPGVDKAACDRAANKVAGNITDLLNQLRAALAKAGV